MRLFKISPRTPDSGSILDVSSIFTLILCLICSVFVWSATAWAADSALQWDINEDADYYIVYWRTADDAEPIDQSDPIDAATTSFPLYSSSSGTEYYYSVKAFNSCGNSSDFSEEILSAYSPYETPLLDSVASDTYTVEIILPQATIHEAGVLIDFSANVSINEVLTVYDDVTWTSCLNGQIGTGADISAYLSAGTHTLMVSVSDGETEVASETLVLTVLESNTSPVVTISSAVSGSLDENGHTYTFSGKAADEEDGDLSASIAWLSDLDGGLGTGASLSAALSAGDHTITARVVDTKDQVSETSITVTADKWDASPVLTIQSTALDTADGGGAQAYTLTGSAQDVEDGDLSGTITWTSSTSGDLGTGASITPILSAGTSHTITAKVTDSAGQSVEEQLAITVPTYNFSPELGMSMDISGELGASGQAVTLTGTAQDTEDGDLSQDIAWSSSIDGALGSGQALEVILASGVHIITARITDSAGNTTEIQQTITIKTYNQAPELSIQATSSGELTAQGMAYTLTGTAQDTEDGVLSTSIVWTSSLTGDLGSGSSLLVTLSSGIHVITAQVTDSGGKVTVIQKTIRVAAFNNPPILEVSYASTGSLGPNGLAYTLTGSAQDEEDGNISDTIVWTSSFSGRLGTGSPLQVTLATGTHTITAHVADSQGKSAETQNTMTVGAFNYAPELAIQSAASGELSADGQAYTLSGSAQDNEDGDLSASIAWTSSLDGDLGQGDAIAVTLSSGSHTITARVTDSSGANAAATKTITVSAFNTPPTVSIVSSIAGKLGTEGQAYTFRGSSDDQEDGDLNSVMSWTSSLDGPLGTGRRLSTTLSTGSHTVTASVSDSGGKTATATVAIEVAPYDDPPTISIDSATAGVNSPEGQAYQLKGSAQDTADGTLGSAITWTSSIDGSLGTGASVNATLSAGTHTVTASVSDSTGNTASATIQVDVAAYDYPPTVSIDSATEGVSSAEGQAYQLTGSAKDAEDGSLSAAIVWVSSLDGNLGSGASVNVTLSSGTHTVTATVTDSQGQTAQNARSVVVDPYNHEPRVAITGATAGTLTSEGQPYTFKGTASDEEDGDLSDSIVWVSSLAGTLGSGSSISLVLSPGEHIIRAQVSDSGGKYQSASREIVIESFNFKPTIQITQAVAGDQDDTGQIFTLSATAEDEEDGSLSDKIIWSSSLQGPLGTGAGRQVHLNAGTHTITAHIEDSFGNKVDDTTLVTSVAVDYPPVLGTIGISEGKAGKDGQLFTFSCSASDQEDGELSSAVMWTSSAVGVLGAGSSLQAMIPPGNHTITARVTDSQGQSTEKTLEFAAVWVNAEPSVRIISIDEGAAGKEGQIFTLTGLAGDEEDGDLSGSIVWTSNLVGDLGDGAEVLVTLTRGTHTITALISDQDGGESQVSTTVTVEEFNAPPVVDIVSVIAQSADEMGQVFELTGTAFDEEDGDLSGSIVWSSDQDGVLGTGANIQALLSGGEHTIRALVTDSGSKEADQTMVTKSIADTGLLIDVASNSFYYFKIVNVTWSGGTTNVNIIKNNRTLASGGPEGTKYFWFSGAGRYKVCEVQGGECSEEIVVK